VANSKLEKDYYKDENYHLGFLAGSKEGFWIGYTAGLRRALELKPKGYHFTPALSSWDENISKEIEKNV